MRNKIQIARRHLTWLPVTAIVNRPSHRKMDNTYNIDLEKY